MNNMRYLTIPALLTTLLFAVALALPAQTVQAATYSYTTYQTQDVAVRIQSLLAQLHTLERQLAELQASQNSCAYYGTCGNGGTTYRQTTVTRADAELFNDYAEVDIRYRDGDRDKMLFNADSRAEVIEYLVDETKNSRAHLLTVTRFTDGDDRDSDDIDDIRRIDVDIRSSNAYVDVRFEDGERDTFTIHNTTKRSSIIEKIADELDLDEDDVEDLIDWDNTSNDEDIEEIEVTIFEDDEEAKVLVRYEDNTTRRFSFNTDDEDDIIKDLARRLDIDKDDVEDLIDFEYEDTDTKRVDADDIDEIEVTIFEDDEEAEALVRYDNGNTDRFSYNTDDEDEVIEELADDLDLDEDDVEDLIDFEYED